MELGAFMMPLHPPEKDRTLGFEEDVEFAVRADELGFSEAWVGQHHTLAWEPIPSNDVFIANVLPRTKNIRLGSGVSILPQHHPVNVAVRLAYLDHLSRGRIYCGFGQGGVPTDWGLFDLPDPQTQGLMTVESIDMILKLWQTDPPFDFKGNFYHIKLEGGDPEHGIGELLQPYQKPHPPIAMSIIRGRSRAAFMAGQRGYIPLSTSLAHPSTLREHWETYCNGAADAGRPEPGARDLARVAQHLHRRIGRRGLGSGLSRRVGGLIRLLAFADRGRRHAQRAETRSRHARRGCHARVYDQASVHPGRQGGVHPPTARSL